METLDAIAGLFEETYTSLGDLQPVDVEAIEGLLHNNAQASLILRSFALREQRLLARQNEVHTPPRQRHPVEEHPTSPTAATLPQSTFDLLTIQAHPHQTNASILSELDSASKFKDGSITLPKVLKGNEIQKLADSASLAVRNIKVLDRHTLRQFSRKAASFFSEAGFSGLSRLLNDETTDPKELHAKYCSYYQIYLEQENPSEVRRVMSQENELLHTFLKKAFRSHQITYERDNTFICDLV